MIPIFSSPHLFPLLRPPSWSCPRPSSIPWCTQETWAPLKVESVFLFQCVFFPLRWKSPSPTLAESLTQVSANVPAFLDNIPNTGTIYRLSRECRFPAQVFIRPSLGRERTGTHWVIPAIMLSLCVSHLTHRQMQNCAFSPSAILHAMLAPAMKSNYLTKSHTLTYIHTFSNSNPPHHQNPDNPNFSEDLVLPRVKTGIFRFTSFANSFQYTKKDRNFWLLSKKHSPCQALTVAIHKVYTE